MINSIPIRISSEKTIKGFCIVFTGLDRHIDTNNGTNPIIRVHGVLHIQNPIAQA